MRQPRFERGTFGSGGRRSIQLSYWRETIADCGFRIADCTSTARTCRYGADRRSIRNRQSAIRNRTVGASGFEPPTSWSRTRRANRTAPRPARAREDSNPEPLDSSLTPWRHGRKARGRRNRKKGAEAPRTPRHGYRADDALRRDRPGGIDQPRVRSLEGLLRKPLRPMRPGGLEPPAS